MQSLVDAKLKYDIEQARMKTESMNKIIESFGEGFVESLIKQIKNDVEYFPKYIGNDTYKVEGYVNLDVSMINYDNFIKMMSEADLNHILTKAFAGDLEGVTIHKVKLSDDFLSQLGYYDYFFSYNNAQESLLLKVGLSCLIAPLFFYLPSTIRYMKKRKELHRQITVPYRADFTKILDA